MGFDDPTDGGSRPKRPDGPAGLARGRFLAGLRAGSSPRIEDHLDGLDPSSRASLLRELLVAERDWNWRQGLDVDPAKYLARFPADGKLIDEVLGDVGPTATISQRDRAATEACLHFGLLSLANGLIAPEALMRALGAWADEPDRPLGEVLVERGHLDESDASMIAALASKHLEQHHGVAWESLIALRKAVRFRLDPGEVADSELRCILAGFVDGPDDPRPQGTAEFGPRYEHIRQHAKGGLGVVNLVMDREMHREVAVKEIREDCADNPDYRARFLREAEVTGRLEHPGIVPVYGMGARDDGRPYYIMRFIRGETLKAAIVRLHATGVEVEEAGPVERPDLNDLVGRFIDACHAVAYAHYRKILHRDLKPINIMLGPFGETLVVDWGLAKSFDGTRNCEHPSPIEEGTLRPQSGSGMTPTRVGSEVGTVGYMSPEQAAGMLTELRPASDIYSLGVTLYILATGRAPFEGANKVEFLRKVREGEFPGPSKVNPSIPPALEAICLKCMALRPVDRYQAVGELIHELERWRAGQPVQAYPEPLRDRLARWSRKHKTALAGAAVLLACSTVGLGIFAERKREENRLIKAERDVANRERAEADRQRTASEASRKFALGLLKSTLREVEGAELTFLARSERFREKKAGQLLDSYRDLARDDPDDKQVKFDLAQACQLAANIGRSMGKLDPPRELYAEAIRLLESLDAWNPEGEDTRLELATLHDDAGEHLRMVGKPKESEPEYLKGLDVLRRPAGPARPAILQQRAEARLQLDLSGALNDLGRLDPAIRASQRAIDLLEPLASGARAERIDRLLLVYALLSRGETLRLGEEFDEASTELVAAARLARELMIAVSDPDTRFAFATAWNAQGFLLIEANPEGSREAAFKAFQDALSYLGPLYKDLPRVISFRRGITSALIGRGICRLGMKKFEEARADFSNATKLLQDLEADIPGHFDHLGLFGLAYANLGRASRAQGKSDAVEFLAKAINSHSGALKANSDSPEDKKLLEGCRRELYRVEEAAAQSSK